MSVKDKKIKFFLLVVLVILFFYISKFFRIDQQNIQNILRGAPGIVSCVVFIVLYVFFTFIIWLGPKDVFRIVGAVVYGAYLSTFLVWLAEMVNVVVLFSLSRKLGREYVESRLKGNMSKWDDSIADSSFWVIFLLRLTPIVPLRFLDLGFGLTKISLRKYFIICAVGTPLRIFWQQFLLSLGFETIMDPNKLSEYLSSQPWVMFFAFVYLALSIVMIIILKRNAKKR
ncbi:MAG: TVP38/TMEM64 family protein [Candidatus Omnitrophica bacterium]|nr:TVP38/TMEM64 family protein [Candidatus Omnitrophota bacterium]